MKLITQEIPRRKMHEKTLQQAVSNLADRGVSAYITNGTVYVQIEDNHLEISDYEIEWQAGEFRQKQTEESI